MELRRKRSKAVAGKVGGGRLDQMDRIKFKLEVGKVSEDILILTMRHYQKRNQELQVNSERTECGKVPPETQHGNNTKRKTV